MFWKACRIVKEGPFENICGVLEDTIVKFGDKTKFYSKRVLWEEENNFHWDVWDRYEGYMIDLIWVNIVAKAWLCKRYREVCS